MISRRLLPTLAVAIVFFSGIAQAQSNIKHVLLISVDGLHALDVANYVQNHPTSALAELASHGVTFSNARTPANSDSFPGLMALVTGGSPITSGLFYDVSYDRTIFDPTNPTCSGGAGNTMVFDESIDLYNAQTVSLNVIDPTKLPRVLDNGACVPLLQPIYGTIYTGSKKKNAEHGGFSFGDTHVGLIVSNPSLTPSVLKTPVATSQVAVTIPQALGRNPNALKSVQIEKTVKLPGLPF